MNSDSLLDDRQFFVGLRPEAPTCDPGNQESTPPMAKTTKIDCDEGGSTMRVYGWLFLAITITNSNIPFAKACDPSFTLINSTPMTIADVFTRETGEDGWSAEQLGEESVLPPANRVELEFYNVSGEHFDVKLVFENGKQETWGNVDLCEISSMNVYHDAKTANFRASLD